MRQLKEEGRSTALLVGAGISASAGIPLASKMVTELKGDPRYNYRFEDVRLNEETNEYNVLMKSLTYKQREEYLRSYINSAKINLAHLYIGMLIKEGYVNTVLTTNFDPLLVKTMALFNHHTYVYDLANTRNYVSDSILFPNIFYLHGQGHSFLMLNTTEELRQPGEYFKMLLNDLLRKHFFLVVGYSGLCDFIFEELCEVPRFSSDLHWVGYKSEDAPKHVREKLCVKDSVRYVNSYGADGFFRELANELELTPASFFDRPFDYLREILNNIGTLQFDDGGGVQNFDLLKQPLHKIDTAIELVEKGDVKTLRSNLKNLSESKLETELMSLILQGKYREVVGRKEEIMTSGGREAVKHLARAYSYLADEAFKQDDPAEGDRLYTETLALVPDNSFGYYNWGTDLVRLGLERNCDEKLLRLGIEKFEWAVNLKPDFYHALTNWGTALLKLYTKTGYKPYLLEAIEKLERANAAAAHIADYSLACCYALLGELNKALDFLEQSLAHETAGLMHADRKHIEADPDLNNLHAEARYTAILDRYLPETGVQPAEQPGG
ncbi:MAG: SIR2 family protein [Chitinophagales bacterium]